jgi:hypothetical protein
MCSKAEQMDGIESVIQQLEKQNVAIDRALEALREVGGTSEGPPRRGPGRPPASAASTTDQPTPETKKRGGVSAAGRKRLAEGMKRRWAVKRAAAQVKRGRPEEGGIECSRPFFMEFGGQNDHT